MTLYRNDFLSLEDASNAEVNELVDLAIRLKRHAQPRKLINTLPGIGLAMIFEKPSLRTRATFSSAMAKLGGHAIDLLNEHMQMGVRETVPDVARNLERWVGCIMARVFVHQTLETLAEYAQVPVINGLSDLEHPCQILADLTTIREHKPAPEGRLKLVFVGDGFNIAHSLLLGAAKLGLDFVFTGPQAYQPETSYVDLARNIATTTGSTITLEFDPQQAVRDADIIYTDSWTSMGQEEEHDKRTKIFQPYQVNSSLVAIAKPDVIVMHCLPAHRGEEITDEVLDGPHSVVFDEAENRMWAQMALILRLLLPEDEVNNLF